MQSVRVVPADDDDDDQATEMNNSFTGEGVIAPVRPRLAPSGSFIPRLLSFVLDVYDGVCVHVCVCMCVQNERQLTCLSSFSTFGCSITSERLFAFSVRLQTMPPACEEGPVHHQTDFWLSLKNIEFVYSSIVVKFLIFVCLIFFCHHHHSARYDAVFFVFLFSPVSPFFLVTLRVYVLSVSLPSCPSVELAFDAP